jgi:hypothetical protein
MSKISNERQTEILVNAIGWFSDHFEDEELLRILREHLKMTDDELDSFGFDFLDYKGNAETSERYPLLIGHSKNGSENLYNVQQVAEYICKQGMYGDVQITLPNDTLLLDTYGPFINRIADMEYREELLKVLIPMQQNFSSENDSGETDVEDENFSMQM